MKPEIETYLAAIQESCPEITLEELQAFGSGLTVTRLRKQAYYYRKGDPVGEIGYLVDGLIRAFDVDDNGDEITIKFLSEHHYAGAYRSLMAGERSDYFFQCLEPVTLVSIPHGRLVEVFAQNAKFEKYGRMVAEEILQFQQNRLKGFLRADAEERYRAFLDQYPHLAQRISVGHLSSYLGVTRQSLTRIRKKLAGRGF